MTWSHSSNMVTFNIKVSVEVEPVLQNEDVKEVKNTQIIKDLRQFYCETCDSTLSLASAYTHARTRKHLENLKKKTM